MHTKIDKARIRLAAIIGVVAIAALLLGATIGYFLTPAQPAEVQSVHNLFVDLNADGRPDLLISGSVLWNVPFLESTPTVIP